MEQLIAETTFLVDFERETARATEGPASHFLQEYEHSRLVITPIVAGEMAAGPSMRDRDRWQAFIRRFRVLPHNEAVCWFYGESYRYLKAQGLLIGSNDLWIAATSRAHAIPLLTRNTSHFQRVPGVEVVGY